jgi:hypothetical protein
VNYAIRFSGPVTALTARRFRHGVGADLICQPSPFARYKDTLVPRRFSHSSLPAYFPFPLHLPAPPPRASGCAELHLLPAGPPSPRRTDTTRPVGKNVAARRLALIRSTPRQHCLVDHPTRASTLDNDVDEAPGVPAGRR